MIRILPENPDVDKSTLNKIANDYGRFKEGLPKNVEEYILDEYKLDVRTFYADIPIKNPFGKASGQLSMNTRQVEEDGNSGLGFVVLKTVIAQDETGRQSMGEWAIKVTRMQPEEIVGKNGQKGWTISWSGRGWHGTFDEYLKFFSESTGIGWKFKMPIIPSCKYHLPAPDEKEWRIDEYNYTTCELIKVWQEWNKGPMPLEKDFSPTLAGSTKAKQKEKILEWLDKVPQLIKNAGNVTLGLKIMNAMFEDDFQMEMLKTVLNSKTRPDLIVYANRLYDPDKEFEEKKGIAYGGPDLSNRNLTILSRLKELGKWNLPISATGNINTGKMALEYILHGAQNCQIHTFFQLPDYVYGMKQGSKVVRALHELYFNPQSGLITWMIHCRNKCEIATGEITKLTTLVNLRKTV